MSVCNLPVYRGNPRALVGYVIVDVNSFYRDGRYNKVYKGKITYVESDDELDVAVRIHKNNDDRSLRRFIKEINIFETIPYVVGSIEYYGWGQYTDTYFMVIQYIEHDLCYMLENDLLTYNQKISAIIDVLNVLKLFHECGLRCPDIKLENMMYADGHIKMCDFDQHAFTVIYSPPERFKDNAKYVGKYSDIWAIGIFILIVWTLELPYQNIIDIDKPDWNLICQELELGYQFDMNDVPNNIKDICNRCLSYEYYKRPSVEWLLEKFNEML